MKKRHNKSQAKSRAKEARRIQEDYAAQRRGEYGPADPMPDGRIRQGQEDAFMRLKRLGQLSGEMEWAVNEILLVYRSRTSALWARVADLQRVGGHLSVQDSAWLIDAGHRYDEWAHWAKQDALQVGINSHSLILDVFNDNLTLGDCDTMLRRRKGTAKAIIERGLKRYALLAGRVAA